MADDDWIEVTPALRIPRSELVLRASRSGGPGGQHVNTSSTRIELTWDVAGSLALADATRAWLLRRLATRLDTTGQLRLVAQEERSQLRNREAVLQRFRELVARAMIVPKTRKPTKPSKAAKRARRDDKTRRAAIKKERKRQDDDS
jgi:ribosome-associated protein